MLRPTLEYQPPDATELKRRSFAFSPAAAIAGGCVAFFIAPMLWGYIASFVDLRSPLPRLVADMLAASGLVVGSFFGGRHVEKSMPDSRGFAIGLTTVTTIATIACGAIRFCVR